MTTRIQLPWGTIQENIGGNMKEFFLRYVYINIVETTETLLQFSYVNDYEGGPLSVSLQALIKDVNFLSYTYKLFLLKENCFYVFNGISQDLPRRLVYSIIYSR